MAFIPAAAAAIGSAVSAVGGIGTIGSILGAGGAIYSGIAQAQAASYQAQVAQRQASIDRKNAAEAQQRAQFEQLMQDRTTKALIGEQLAAQGASGLNINSESFVLTRRNARRLGRLDALNVRNAGDIESYNYNVSALGAEAEADMSRMAGRNALVSGFLDAGRSLVGGSTSTRGGGNRFTRRRTDPWYGTRRVTA